jgi:2-oxo-hept-3-ene-1,7-dioate hydratase
MALLRPLAHAAGLSLLLLTPAVARAACPGPEALAAYLADFAAARPSAGFGTGLTLADAACARHRLIDRLPAQLGPVVGYKAAFTNPAAQRRFGVEGPAWGAMFAWGLHPSGVTLPAGFGSRPHVEADLLVVVKGPGLAGARDAKEALRHIEAVVPFIELPDLLLRGPVTGPALIATNVGFRAGVLGTRIPMEPSEAFLEALAAMTVVAREERGGVEIGRARGAALMEHPLHAALWLARSLRQEGIELRPGDLLSLGAFLPAAPAAPGTRISVRYLGLPGDPSVSVTFE